MKFLSKSALLAACITTLAHSSSAQVLNLTPSKDSVRSETNTARQNVASFYYITGVSKMDFVTIGETSLVTTFTISTPGTYTLVENIGYQARNNSATAGASCAIYINSNDVVLDLGSFTLYNNNNGSGSSSTNAIDIGASKKNIVIKNGNINGFYNAGIKVRTGCNNIRLQDVTITGCNQNAVECVGTAGNSTIVSDVLVQNCQISETNGENNFGLNFRLTENILIQDTTIGFGHNSTAGSESIGAYFLTCTNVRCHNVSSGGHYGDGAQGYKLVNVNSAIFEGCVSQGNYAIDSTDAEKCVGFLIETSTAVRLNNCESSGHVAKTAAQGFYYGNAVGCITENCTSSGIRLALLDATDPATAMFAGFYSVSGVGNTWKDCSSENNFAGNTSTSDGYGAIGFYLSSEKQSALVGCKSRGHGSIYNHAANAIGIYLDDTTSYTPVGGTAMKIEDCQYCQVTNCEASSNCTSATSGTTAYGIRDDATDTKNIIIKCFAFGNSDSATTRVVTNYYMDLPVGGTTAANWPRVEANMDGLIDLANTPDYYNVSVTS